ncbi:Lipase [Rhizoctonia solani]|uniref:Lipase n=1 Tax=Rhizoctonia solani TaxID=456999 RepID=A0A8H8T1D1_9AGAM|nr:Lipase [Rhizoctonia solani]QRW25694.1 Lipase [Rhizoctonia solani]
METSIEASNDILDFTPYAVGGDGGATPYWYVGYHAGSHSVIVGNQGSDFEQLEAFLTNANFFQKNLNSTLFPGVSTEAKAHGGFVDAQATSADAKLAAVHGELGSKIYHFDRT